jgi:hypothetical protein
MGSFAEDRQSELKKCKLENGEPGAKDRQSELKKCKLKNGELRLRTGRVS